MKRISLLRFIVFSVSLGLAGCATQQINAQKNTATVQALNANATSSALWEADNTTIWTTLKRSSTQNLARLENNATDTSTHAWIELAKISKAKNLSTPELVGRLQIWKAANSDHPGNAIIPNSNALAELQRSKTPQHIAILLPSRGPFASSGQSIREGFIKAYYKRPAQENQQTIKFYDTTSVNNVQTLYQKALTDGADFIVGPLLKSEVDGLGQIKPMIPILALNYTQNSLPANFYEFGLSPEDEAIQIADRAHEQGLHQALVIAPDTQWGKRVSDQFNSHWQSLGGSIVDTWTFKDRSTYNTQIAQLLNINQVADKALMHEDNTRATLEQQRRHDFDVIILFAQPQDARAIVPLLRYYYVNQEPIFATSAIYAGLANPAKDNDLNGVTVCDTPWTIKESRNKNPLLQNNRLYAVGQDAYLISQSIHRLRSLPDFPVHGTTGALTLNNDQQVHRRLPCATFTNGLL